MMRLRALLIRPTMADAVFRFVRNRRFGSK